MMLMAWFVDVFMVGLSASRRDGVFLVLSVMGGTPLPKTPARKNLANRSVSGVRAGKIHPPLGGAPHPPGGRGMRHAARLQQLLDMPAVPEWETDQRCDDG
jgi:hypothetical protein